MKGQITEQELLDEFDNIFNPVIIKTNHEIRKSATKLLISHFSGIRNNIF